MPNLDFSKVDNSLFSTEEKQDGLPAVMDQALRENPEQYAENLRLSQQSGVPVEGVASDPVAVQSKLNFDNVDFGRMSTVNPHTSRFLTTFNNAVIAQDDIPILTSLEKIFSGLGESINLGFRKWAVSTVLGATDGTANEINNLIPATALPLGVPDRMRYQMSRQFAGNLGITTDEELVAAKQEQIEALIGEVERIQQRRQDITPEDLTLIEAGVRSGIESLANMAPGFALMLLTQGRSALLATIGTQTGFSSYGDARAGGLEPGRAAAFALLDASIEVATELLPTSTLEKMITGGAAGRMSKEAVRFLIQEMGTEQIATLGQSLNAYSFGLDEELANAEGAAEIRDIMLERAAITGIATAVAGGTQAGIAAGFRLAINNITQDQVTEQTVIDQEQQVLTELDQIATDSNLKQRSPEAFSQFVQDLDQDQDTHVYLDAAQTSLYLQEKVDEIGHDPALTMLAERVQRSAATGEDVALPVDEFINVVAGTPHFEALREGMTLRQEGVSPFRQEQINNETQNYISKLVDEAQENVSQYVEAQEIFTQVRDQLIDTGQLNPRAANTLAQLVPAWATVFAERNGISVQDAYIQSGLSIVGPQTGQAAKLESERSLLQRAKDTIFGSQEVAEQPVLTGPVAPGGIEGQQIIDALNEQGGITIARDGMVSQANTGYVVSVRSFNVEDANQVPALIKSQLEDISKINREDLVVGAFDMGDGRFSVDTNVIVDNREDAIELGQRFDQQSIYDLAAQDVIETGGKGEGATQQKFEEFILSDLGETDDGIGDSGVLERPPVKDGVITLDHFSRVSGIETLDPGKFGTGIRAAESRRSYDEFWVPRTAHGIATNEPGGYRKERALGDQRYTSQVQANDLYDIQADPDGFRDDLSEASNQNERINLLEKKVKDAGYAGYWQKHPSLGLIAVTFDALPTQQVPQPYQQPPVVTGEGKLTQAEFAKILDQMAVDRYGGPLEEQTEENKQLISDTLVEEVMDEVGVDSAAVHWYQDSIRAALGYASQIHPEIATNPTAKKVFVLSLALTSNGADVKTNSNNAEKIYANYKETGKFDISVGAGYGTRGSNIQGGFDKLQGLIDNLGLEEAFEFLDQRFTVRELKQAGFNVSGEKMDTEVYGSSIFGPKVGGAFYQNLIGNWNTITMDQWFMKTWGRVTGTALRKDNIAAVPKNGSERQWIREVFGEVQNKLKDQGVELDLAAIQALLWGREKDFYRINGAAKIRAEVTDYEQEFHKIAIDRLGGATPATGLGSSAGGTRLTAKERSELRRNQKTPLLQQERGSYDPTTAILRLTEASDLSTFVHEFAHFMLDQEIKTTGSLLPEITQWVVRNRTEVAVEANSYTEGKVIVTREDITRYVEEGTTGFDEKDGAVDRAMHEQFARGFEQYLMTGVSPSVELRNVFRTIARWLQRIYSAIRQGLNVKVDEEMSSVFDRLLATEEQIAAAEARARVAPIFTDAAMAGMTEEQFAEYQAQQSVSTDTAHEGLREKLIKQLTRQAKAEWRSQKSDIKDEIAEQLKQQKIYRTIDSLRNGEVKLDRATVKEMVGEEAVSKRGNKFVKIPSQLRNMTLTGQEGIHPDEAAVLFGYGSGAEMLSEIIEVKPIDKVADEQAQERMLEINGDILNDGTIEMEADAAMQNEERAKLLLMELKALARGTTVPPIDRQTVKLMAEQQISKLGYRSIHPGKYRKAEIAAAQQAAVALESGNKEVAAAAKMRQLMNFYLGQAALSAREETIKIVDHMKRYNTKRVRQNIQRAENEYMEQIDKILSRFEFRKTATLKSVDQKNQDINTWMHQRMEEDGDALVLTAPVLNESYVTHWKNVPHSDLIGISDSVRNIEHVARYSSKMTSMGEEIDFKKLVNSWTQHMDRVNTTKFKPERTTVDEGRKWGKWAMAQMTKIPWMASWLDGGERVGMTHQILVQPFTEALDNEYQLFDSVAQPVVHAIMNRSEADLRRHNRKLFIREIRDENNDGNLMGHQVLAVALNTGNESNLRKLLLGEGWANPDNDAEITFDNPKLQAVLKHMTKSDWDLVQLIWDQMEQLYPKLSEVHKSTTGLTPPKIEATPIVTPYGEYNGGYYPVKYDANRSRRAELNEERLSAQVDSMFSTTGSIHSSVNASATNERTGFYDPIRLSLDVVPNHFQETIHFITHHAAVREVNKLLRNTQVSNMIKAKLGPEEFAQLKPWLNDIAKDGRESANKVLLDSVFTELRMGVTLGVMGFKASTGIIQISGLSNSIAEVGTSNMSNAMRRILRSPADLSSAWDFALENSNVMKHRAKTMDREMRFAFEKLQGKKGFYAAVQQASMKHIAYVQTYMVDLPSWYAAYMKELGNSGDEKKAFQYADFVVEQVQGSGATKDMAQVMRNQSGTHRIFTMFMTFFSSLWNAQRDIVRGFRGGQYSTTTVAAKAMWAITIPVLFDMLLRGELFDEDDEFDGERFATNTALFPLQGVPLLRDVVAGVIGNFGYNISPVSSVIERGTQGLQQVVTRGFTDEEITASQVEGTVKLVGAFLGVPGVNQVWSTTEHLYDVFENGEDLTTREFLFGPDRE